MWCKRNGADFDVHGIYFFGRINTRCVKSRQKLDIFEYERPIGIQLFGSDVDSMREAAIIAAQAQPDLIDINYGCPVKNVACKGAGAALLQDIPKMVAMTKAIVDAVNLPVTVKTRLGWDERTLNVTEVCGAFAGHGIKALTVHGPHPQADV